MKSEKAKAALLLIMEEALGVWVRDQTGHKKSKPHPSKALTLFDFRKAERGEGAAEEESEPSQGGHTAPETISKT